MVALTRAMLYHHTDEPEGAPGETIPWAPGSISQLDYNYASVDSGVTVGMVTLAIGRRNCQCGCGVEVDLTPQEVVVLGEELVAAVGRTTEG